MKYAVPEHIRGILKKLNSVGYDAYIVGGCVRDMVMGRTPHDWDITTSAPCEKVRGIFERTAPTGIKYGTVTVLFPEGEAQVTTFRADGDYHNGRSPDSVEFLSSLNEDLARRDFTVNAMAMDSGGRITDLFGGMEDIENGIIRCVGDPETRFREDALRIMRGLRFSAQLGLGIEEKTYEAMRLCAGMVYTLSGERMRDEIEKILLSERPETLNDAADMGLLKRHLPCAVFDNLRRAGELPADREMRWTAMCASAGLSEIPEALRMDGKTSSRVRDALKIASDFAEADVSAQYLLTVYGSETLLCASAADYMRGGANHVEWMRAATDGEPVKLAVNGGDISLLCGARGREIGALIDKLLRHVCEKTDENERDRLIYLAKKWLEEERE